MFETHPHRDLASLSFVWWLLLTTRGQLVHPLISVGLLHLLIERQKHTGKVYLVKSLVRTICFTWSFFSPYSVWPMTVSLMNCGFLAMLVEQHYDTFVHICLWMNPNAFADPMNFHLAPTTGYSFHFSKYRTNCSRVNRRDKAPSNMVALLLSAINT